MPNLANKNKCVGCTACLNVCPAHCIEVNRDAEGFAYPDVVRHSDCVECGLCEKICPVLREVIKVNDIPSAYAAVAYDDLIRKESSSGGIFTELAKRVIFQNGVVYGAAYDESFNVRHCCADNAEDLQKLRGAKYSESILDNTFLDILEKLKQGQQVLFSGTPCQVAGLKAFVRKDFNNLYCVDFVCHGVPSPEAWKLYIEYRSKKDANGSLPCNINLRSKETGWSRYQYSNVFEYENGKRHSVVSSQSPYMKLFTGDYISRPSCEDCKFKGYHRCSDITLGDFWGIWDIDSEMDDDKGTSVVLVHTEKGQTLWNEISDDVKYKEVTLEQASQQNPSMLVSSKANVNRDLVLKKIQEGDFEGCEEFFEEAPQQKVSLRARVKGKIKSLVISFARSIGGLGS